MRCIRFDSIGGASGDMILAALTGLGADADPLVAQLRKIPVEDWRLEREPVSEQGLQGWRVKVVQKEHSHHHRHLSTIQELVQAAGYSDVSTQRILRAFQLLAEAEGAVHGCPPEKVHFHEVGAVDSIVDMAGACLALEALGVEATWTGPLPIGCGTVECAHGLMPIPAPATARLLLGHELVQTDEPFELVTPTGAALLTSWQMDGPPQRVRILKTALAFGHRRLNGRVNLLRATLCETVESNNTGDEVLVLETQVDDTTPEIMGALMEMLLEQGALDAFISPVYMKKQRPGFLLTVLCNPDQEETFALLMMRESGSFGVRKRLSERLVLERREEALDTPWGAVRIKIGSFNGNDVVRSPEFADCQRCAKNKQVPVRTVYQWAATQGQDVVS